MVRLVNAAAIGKSVMELLSRSRMLRLRANSSPATLLMLRPPALKNVKPRRSASVNGPVDFCKAARTAAFRAGSGMDTSCAASAVVKRGKANIQATQKTVFNFFTGMGVWAAPFVPDFRWDEGSTTFHRWRIAARFETPMMLHRRKSTSRSS